MLSLAATSISVDLPPWKRRIFNVLQRLYWRCSARRRFALKKDESVKSSSLLAKSTAVFWIAGSVGLVTLPAENSNSAVAGGFTDFTSAAASVAIHVSERTAAGWPGLGGPHADWSYWHIYGFLMESLRSDGTPFTVVTDADIEAGSLLAGGKPRYAILFSLAATCVTDETAAQIDSFVVSGGHAYVGSTAWTHDGSCQPRSLTAQSVFEPTEVVSTAENQFSPAFAASNTIDDDCSAPGMWINAIDDVLPTWIQYELPEPRLVSKIALVHSPYVELGYGYGYRVANYRVQVAAGGSCTTANYTTVAANSGSNTNREYQETSFTPVLAKCIRVQVDSSYEAKPFPPHQVRNWAGFSAFQVFSATGQPLIKTACATPHGGEGEPAYGNSQVVATSKTAFSSAYAPSATINDQDGDLWLNGISDPLPTWIQYELPVARSISRVGIVHSSYGERGFGHAYLAKDYDIQVSRSSCAAGNFITVATNQGNKRNREYQETRFPAAIAKCVRLNIRTSWEDIPYPSQDSTQWVGISSFQAFESTTRRPLIQHQSGPIAIAPADPANASHSSALSAYGSENAFDAVCNNQWLTDQPLPSWIQYKLSGVPTISKVAVVHSSFDQNARLYSYRIKDYDIQVSSDTSQPCTNFVTVARNRGNDVSGEYQETSFTPVQAHCIRIRANSSWVTIPYVVNGVSQDTTQWVGLNGLQAFESITDRPILQNSCIVPHGAPTRPRSTPIGLSPTGVALIGDLRRTATADPLVSHLENDTVVRGWKLARRARDTGFSHEDHWAGSNVATTAAVLATDQLGKPVLTAQPRGNGRYVYHAEFNPLAGYSMHTVANFAYGFVQKAIDAAHVANDQPNVRLGAWPYPHIAALMTRHDHRSNYGFDGVVSSDDAQIAQIEAQHGLVGSYFLRTHGICSTSPCVEDREGPDAALPAGTSPCRDNLSGAACDAAVQANINMMLELGAQIGSHTTNESTLPTQFNFETSATRLKAYLGYAPTLYAAPGAYRGTDATIQALQTAGFLTKGDVAHGAHPHFALKIDSAAEYSAAARWPIVDIPATGYYAPLGSDAFAGSNIYGHEISADPYYCHMDGTIKPCMEKAVDLMYSLGGIINIYDHIGDRSGAFRAIKRFDHPSSTTGQANPTPEQFVDYLTYAGTKPFVFKTNTRDISVWWNRRDKIRIEKSYVTAPIRSVTVTLTSTSSSDAGPFSVEVDLPFTSPLTVWVNNLVTTNYQLVGQRIRVSAGAPSTVTIKNQ